MLIVHVPISTRHGLSVRRFSTIPCENRVMKFSWKNLPAALAVLAWAILCAICGGGGGWLDLFIWGNGFRQ
jgi:hypothetical protein